MGTRSLTTFIETYKDKDGKKKKTKLCTMYRQFDGYPSGHGSELAEFLSKGKLVNGLGLDNKGLVFNGIGCLSAQVISHFKGDTAGGFYMVNGINHGEEYRYEIEADFDAKDIILRCLEVGYMKGDKYMRGTIKRFEGSPKEFIKWLAKEEKEAE
jgi:hypothetical protein